MILAFAENSIQLVPDGTLLFHILLVLVMVWILNRTLFKPVNRVLAEREHKTQGRSDEAHKILRDVDEKLLRYEQSLRIARTESYQLLESERLEATRDRQNKLSVIRQEINQSVEEQKAAIQDEASEARSRLSKEAHQLALNISAQILSRPPENLRQSKTYN